MSVVSIIIPINSILAFRKAITSMKDVASVITLRTSARKFLQISVLDHFECSAMYAHIPVAKHNEYAWINIASEDLNKLASALKCYPNSVIFTITECRTAMFVDANSKKPIVKSYYVNAGSLPNPVRPINIVEDYYLVPFVSLDLLSIFINLCIGSGIMSLTLYSNGKLELENHHEHGTTFIEKQLVSSVDCQFSHSHPLTILCKMKCVIKFIKQCVNPLVNCSKKTCILGIPKRKEAPLMLQFLLSHQIYAYFLMMSYHTPLRHTWTPNSHQNPIQLRIVSPSSSSIIGFQGPQCPLAVC